MRRVLTERRREVVELAGVLADEFAERAGQHDRENTFPSENWPRMRESGFLNLTVPPELGGFGADLYELMLAQERLAAGDGSTALAVLMHLTAVAGMASGWRRTRDARSERLLRSVVEDGVVFASCTSEAGYGGALADCATAATKVDGGYLLNGRKIFFTESSVATHFTTNAKAEHPTRGPHVVFFNGIPIDAPGVTLKQTWDTLGMRGTQSNDCLLDDVFVADEALFHAYPVGRMDALIGLSVMTWNVPCFGVVALGIASGGMEWARDFVVKRGRQRDGEVQHAFARMEVLLESARAVLYRHASEAMSGEPAKQLTVQEVFARGNLAKYVACENAIAIMDLVMSVAGGAGYHRRAPVERMYRDVRAGAIMPYNSADARVLFAQTALGLDAEPIVDYADSGLASFLSAD